MVCLLCMHESRARRRSQIVFIIFCSLGGRERSVTNASIIHRRSDWWRMRHLREGHINSQNASAPQNDLCPPRKSKLRLIRHFIGEPPFSSCRIHISQFAQSWNEMT